MTDLTLPQRLKIAGGIARVLANHGSDVASLVGDAKAAMRIAAEIHGVIDGVTAQSAPKPSAAPADAPDILARGMPSDVHALAGAGPSSSSGRKLSAAHAVEHVEHHGLTAAEQAIFDRASQSSG